MSNITQVLFEFSEIAALLLRTQDIHEGHWGLYLEFGLQGTNLRLPPQSALFPAAIAYVLKIGLQQFPEANSMTVDAAEINPPGTGIVSQAMLIRKPTLQ